LLIPYTVYVGGVEYCVEMIVNGFRRALNNKYLEGTCINTVPNYPSIIPEIIKKVANFTILSSSMFL